MTAANHPGKMLLETFMQPRDLSQNALARALEVPPRRINEIILGKRKITPDTDLRLCRYFGLQTGFWLQLQVASDLEAQRKLLSTALDKLPTVGAAEESGPGFYARLAARRGDDSALRGCVEQVVQQIEANDTTEKRPGMLLGRIQSGKTRAFIGVAARAFDRGFDVTVIMTKGTKTLAAQTVARLNADFANEIDADELLVFDIMKPPGRLIKGDLKKKLIIVAKKQVDNLERLNRFFDTTHPALAKAKVLLIDDEADLASIRFVKVKGDSRIVQGQIAKKLDEFRSIVASTAFLQVTATPYSLYLQPDGYKDQNNNPVFKPKKPAFTVLLPMHGGYVGGDVYFGAAQPGSVESRLFVEVEPGEHDALRVRDRRRIKPEKVLETPNCAGLARGVVAFVLAACIRQWQQREAGERRKKYSMVIHNDTQKSSHSWQSEVVEWIVDAIQKAAASGDDKRLGVIFDVAFDDLEGSILADGGLVPDRESAYEMFLEAFEGDEVVRETVNSDNDVLALLDDKAELRLRTAFNIFIGGSILDRGITIPNLIAFYYGRNPQRTQADTVLQHSRMYGNRPRADVAVTRLYTSEAVYDRMYTINNFETALREAFEDGAHEQGVVFIQSDDTGRVRPCAPDKLLLSDVVSMRPGGFYLPTRFMPKTAKAAADADKAIRKLVPSLPAKSQSLTISLEVALALFAAARAPLEVAEASFDWAAMESLIRFYARKTDNQIELYMETGRRLDRRKSGDKSGVSIVGTRLRDVLRDPSREKPALILLQQEGATEENWKGFPFWWPILAAPSTGEPCIFAAKTVS